MRRIFTLSLGLCLLLLRAAPQNVTSDPVPESPVRLDISDVHLSVGKDYSATAAITVKNNSDRNSPPFELVVNQANTVVGEVFWNEVLALREANRSLSFYISRHEGRACYEFRLLALHVPLTAGPSRESCINFLGMEPQPATFAPAGEETSHPPTAFVVETHTITECKDTNATLVAGKCECNPGFSRWGDSCAPTGHGGSEAPPAPPPSPHNPNSGNQPSNDLNRCLTHSQDEANRRNQAIRQAHQSCMSSMAGFAGDQCRAMVTPLGPNDINENELMTYYRRYCTAEPRRLHNESEDTYQRRHDHWHVVCQGNIATSLNADERSRCVDNLQRGSGNFWHKFIISAGPLGSFGWDIGTNQDQGFEASCTQQTNQRLLDSNKQKTEDDINCHKTNGG